MEESNKLKEIFRLDKREQEENFDKSRKDLETEFWDRSISENEEEQREKDLREPEIFEAAIEGEQEEEREKGRRRRN